MNGFVKKSVGTLTLGEKLKRLRSDRRVSLNEISRVTRIQTKYLEDLEEGRYDNLPADVYVKGFLKSYAEFFGLDDKIFLKLYEKERGIKKNLSQEKDSSFRTRKPISINFISITPKKAALFGIGLFALLVIIFIYRELGSFASTPKLVILSPADNSEVDGNSMTVSGATEKDAQVFINGQPILVNDDGKFLETLTLQSGPNSINVKAVNRFDKEAEKTITINSKIQSSSSDNSSDQDQKNGASYDQNTELAQEGLSLEIRVDPGPVWLSVEADGNLVFSGTMLSGATQVFQAKDKIVVNSGKGNATLVRLNGKDIGKLSEDSGAVRGVVFDKNTQY